MPFVVRYPSKQHYWQFHIFLRRGGKRLCGYAAVNFSVEMVGSGITGGSIVKVPEASQALFHSAQANKHVAADLFGCSRHGPDTQFIQLSLEIAVYAGAGAAQEIV